MVQEHDFQGMLLSGLSAAATTWWQGLGLLALLLTGLAPAVGFCLARRVISLRQITVHPDAHLYERQGNIVIIDERAIKRISSGLVKRAECPRCQSMILMWYQKIDPLAYYDPGNPARLKKGAAVYVRCKECRYTYRVTL